MSIQAFAPTGSPIRGTADIGDTFAYVSHFENGEPVRTGITDTDTFYNTQSTLRFNDERVYLDRDGDWWPESDLIFTEGDKPEPVENPPAPLVLHIWMTRQEPE